MSDVSVANLRQYIRAGFNILAEGPHGVGKTVMLQEACAQEGLKLKIFNAASMDAYTDLVGVPKFVVGEDGGEELRSVRPHDVDNADVIFVDEINRTLDPKTTNGFFELIQFRSINGEKLPNLKCVVAAQNPASSEEYDVAALDPALVDRFHLTLQMKPNVSRAYLARKFDSKIADALVEWHDGHSNSKSAYVSPRRVEMLGHVWLGTRSFSALAAAMPPEGTFDVGKLYTLLKEATMTDQEKENLVKSRVAVKKRLSSKKDSAAKILPEKSVSVDNIRQLNKNSTSSELASHLFHFSNTHLSASSRSVLQREIRRDPNRTKLAYQAMIAGGVPDYSSSKLNSAVTLMVSAVSGIGNGKLLQDWQEWFEILGNSERAEFKKFLGYRKSYLLGNLIGKNWKYAGPHNSAFVEFFNPKP